MKALHGIKVVSLALNLPGPAALQRLKTLGAGCIKFEPLAGDPMQSYEAGAYDQLHAGIRVLQVDLKIDAGQHRLQRELASADVLLTSFRPSALQRLGLGWTTLHRQHPDLCLVSIVGAPGALAEIPGHDLTYMAEQGLIQDLALPPTLFADMGGALLASEAVLSALMQRQKSGRGTRHEVALSQAAAWLALPRRWGLTTEKGAVGGAHAGYRVYACKDGRVAVAALEPHFAQALCAAAGIPQGDMMASATHRALQSWFATQTRRTLNALAQRLDLPLHILPRD
jgi:crotonobetainyl-CoA:carnitine CoA-transferase CaiB-like acyl-CoA transferase